jgi:hypothetical protein
MTHNLLYIRSETIYNTIFLVLLPICAHNITGSYLNTEEMFLFIVLILFLVIGHRTELILINRPVYLRTVVELYN